MLGLTPAQAAQQAQQVAAQQSAAVQAAQAAGRGASIQSVGLPQAAPPAPPPVPTAEWSVQLQPTAAQVTCSDPWNPFAHAGLHAYVIEHDIGHHKTEG